MLQSPAPGEHLLYFRGDIAEITLNFGREVKGKAFFRTNLGKAEVLRREIISEVETGRSARGESWHDLPMNQISSSCFSLSVSLLEVGNFEGKCLFFEDGKDEPVWVPGANVQINVDPGEYCAGNTLYCAFPRQFGRHKTSEESENYEQLKELTDKGYSVIPPSGTFRKLKGELDFIFDKLNSRILHLLPVNPTPTVYGRMGVFGSPYASLDFTAVDPALAEFDTTATPLEQFCELVDEVHLKDGRVFIDIAINHTGWAAKLHETNPDWLVRDDSGEIVSPGAWGVTWADLTELDHSRLELWQYLAKVFIVWCSRGVDGFRCDAGYMIPVPAWRYIIACVRTQYPDSVFLLEGLGGDPRITENLLNKGNMNWAYSELFQNYSKEQIVGYMDYSARISRGHGLMFHYAETHDNSRLASVSNEYASMRTGLCAMLSASGAFGFTNGVEWFAKEKIDVHMDRALNWGAKVNQVDYISRINALLRSHPAFHARADIRFIHTATHSALAFVRSDRWGENRLLVLINLDSDRAQPVSFARENMSCLNGIKKCLITGKDKSFMAVSNSLTVCELGAGECICVAIDCEAAESFINSPGEIKKENDPIRRQWARGLVLDYISARSKSIVLERDDIAELTDLILSDPYELCHRIDGDGPVKVVEWSSPADIGRMVMIPPNHALLIRNNKRFRARVADENGIVRQLDSIELDDGSHFTLFSHFKIPLRQCEKSLVLYLYGDENLSRHEAKLLILSNGDDTVSSSLSNRSVVDGKPVFLATNNRGGMCHIPVAWGQVYSRYDALLAANISPEIPEDRTIMFTRFRGWVNHQGYSHALDTESLQRFTRGKSGEGVWHFHVPVGSGCFVALNLIVKMDEDDNKLSITVERPTSPNDEIYLADSESINLVFRPDIEDRNFHTDTKAMHGPEHNWPSAIKAEDSGFVFSPDSTKKLRLEMDHASFHSEREWYYCVHHEVEASRGLEAFSDLFSPGYFRLRLKGCEQSTLVASVNCNPETRSKTIKAADIEPDLCFDGMMELAMEQFVVNRNELKTVIAGYPWFLDWGRDTLICTRGLIAAGSVDEYKKGKGLLKDTAGILQAFARFEENGTLPNMIHGDDARNRETSDAPLWLFTAVRDFCKKTGDKKFISTRPPKSDRTMQEILIAIAEGYIAGTPNGIKVDPESALVFSPSHFTWMDTNYPAGTPREGYPIEIQSLWFAALNFLSEITNESRWKDMEKKVQNSIVNYFVNENRQFLSDCLHCKGYKPASEAVADDALRSNQLLAVTLGAVSDRKLAEQIVKSSEQLLVPGAIRSLADRPVEYPLAIHGMDGQLLNDPNRPYWGHYEGDEDTRRKPAYHNGTAWSWPFPSWSEAYFMLYGDKDALTAKSVLSSAKYTFTSGCVGHTPEIIDGSYPHTQRGCDAQAWGVTELYRVWKMVN